MKNTAFVLGLLFLGTTSFAQGLEITPQNAADLDSVIDKLAEVGRTTAWCARDCATLYEFKVEGTLESGVLRYVASGVVTGHHPAMVSLFGIKPFATLEDQKDATGRNASLFWTGNAYAVNCAPGSFQITGTVKIPKNSSATLEVPGPVGLVNLKIADADIIGSSEIRGVKNATYQLTRRQKNTGKSEEEAARLRLEVSRTFHMARDKQFSVEIRAKGVKAGQIIVVDLLQGEAIEEMPGKSATVKKEGERRWIDWVADSPTPTLNFSGKWTASSIVLAAPAGASKETWRVQCDDPYSCDFKGDAETIPGESGHLWAPLAGQKLEVTWHELTPLQGIHTVAQEVTLSTHPVGQNLQQKMQVLWSSSSGSVTSMELPPGALISRFQLNEVTLPILKDLKGRVQLSLPAGRSTLVADWEIAGKASALIRPPVPTFSEPVGTVWHRIYPADGHSTLATGGLAGSPRVALWPNLAACLALALAIWWVTKFVNLPVSSTWMWIIACLGFAIGNPGLAVPLALSLGAGRWFSRTTQTRGKFRTVVEITIWGGLVLSTIGIVFGTLQTALFSSSPLEVSSFVGGGANPNVPNWNSWQALLWGTFVAGDPNTSTLPSVWALTVSVVWIRLIWAVWAIIVALFLAKEGKLAIGQLAAYWEKAGWRGVSQLEKR